MKKKSLKEIHSKINKLLQAIFGKRIFEFFVSYFAYIGGINLQSFAYHKMGVLNSENETVSGEAFVIKSFLKDELGKAKKTLFFFDVGANIGEYSETLSNQFPKAKIFAFEPTKKAYEQLRKRLSGTNVNVFNLGFGLEKSAQKMYSYAHDAGSAHSSIYKDVFTKIHQTEKFIEIDFVCTTIDDFCDENYIDHIDFLKVDTEGSEFSILKGASRMLSQNRISFIQFEFNEMNVVSRVFLKDFYDLLSQYDFYRLSEEKLIPLGVYNSINEIFKFQNILAVNRNGGKF